ncbi:MAG: hypothetical protein HY962_07730 [Ignavibacteriae bacterium]|nr:hypothetical protein [Ignavibacteriota bacterium]
MTPSVVTIPSLADIPFDESCLVLADARLPRVVLDALPDPILVESGEEVKTLAAVERLAGQVLARRAARPLVLVAVGGGSLGDAVGFLASILWRGVPVWQVPTTLLAMADSAHGGKTAVNLGAAKNQLGTFHPAERVYIVESLLGTLPYPLRREGFVEILKALMLGDAARVTSLHPEEIEELVYRPYARVAPRLGELLHAAIAVKHSIVAEDPREERGIRTVLNLGHTLGHALERSAGIPHGDAVAWGLRVMLEVSRGAGLPPDVHTALAALLFPLLRPLPKPPTRDELLRALGFDKKHGVSGLRSVLLSDAGRPIVTDAVGRGEWVDAFEVCYRAFDTCTVNAWLRDAQMVTLRPEAGKSELNRALMIAAQRVGATHITGVSDADDVRAMRDALRALGVPLEDVPGGYRVDYAAHPPQPGGPPRVIDCGSGGTTFRFLLALAATHVKETLLRISPQLDARPHDALVHALRKGGASIEHGTDALGPFYRVRGWDDMPASFSVDAAQSSQYASAIALLAAGSDTPFTLRLLGDVASRSYLDMTVRMLEAAGVETIAHGDLIALNPTARLREPVLLAAPSDSSAAAVWKTAAFFEHMLRVDDDGAGPDAAIDAMLEQIVRGQKSDEIVLNCAETPDLVPVLGIAALRSSKPVRITGVPQLRAKESNRIDGYIASLAAVGVRLQPAADGFLVPAHAARGLHDGTFHPLGDHRLLMAGFLLSMIIGEITLADPWCVAKSYPAFWEHARMAGWTVRESIHDQHTM